MKRIKGYEDYGITSCGKVWSFKTDKFMSLYKNHKGYYNVKLSKDGVATEFKVHRLVAEAYIPNPNNYDTVDHIDGNKEHNYIKNLQWMTRRDNLKKSKDKQVKCIELNRVFQSLSDAARELNLDKSNISKACRGVQKTSGGYHWKYVE